MMYYTKKNQRLELPLILKMMTQIAQGLNYLHLSNPKIIHRDLKTQNILVDSSDNIQIADFGISRVIDNTMTGFTGTVSYMAPEVVSGQGHYSEKVDVYSYAIIAWELFTGDIPFKGMLPIQIAYRISQGERLLVPTSCPTALLQLFNSCWQQTAEKRPSFTQVLNYLEDNFPTVCK